ncbi:MAG TPA: FAD-dependent oxidoreductase, partial [Anaerolineae bacterium]|nr:FAD-dependent oxidoreductase [Anaerolineae bacterium]
LEIVAYERTGYVSYGSCGLPYLISGVVPEASTLIARTPEQFARQGIETHTHHEVLAIDAGRQTVRVRDLDQGHDSSVAYDRLVIATGASAIRPPLPGIDLEGVFVLRNLEDGIAIKRFIAEEQPSRAVIIGGGYVGVEMAEAFVERGLQTTMLDMQPQVLDNFDPDVAQKMQDELERNGVTVFVDDAAQGIEGDGQGRVRAVVSQRGRHEADLVLIGAGVRAESLLAKEAGVELGAQGAIAVDDGMRTSVPDVYAAGDCAETFHLLLDGPSYVPLGSTANKQGRVAGTNAAGGEAVFKGVVGTAITKAFDLGVAVTGLTEKAAKQLGRPARAVSVEHGTRAHYYPGPGSIHVKLVWSDLDGRLLGAQIAGPVAEAKRIDVLATALHHGLTIEDLKGLDLSYAPPFAPVWDPILVAANVAAKS